MKTVEFIPKRGELGRLLRFSIDVLEFHTEVGISSLRIAGWVVARHGPPVRAVCFHSGFDTKRLAVNVPRMDVAAAFPVGSVSEGCGFEGVLSVDGLGRSFSLVVTAAQAGDGHAAELMIWLGEILGQQHPLVAREMTSFQAPVCVTCLGRTGSTLMMRILHAHPEIVVAGGYPYETRYAHKAAHSIAGALEATLPEGIPHLGTNALYDGLRDQLRRNVVEATVSAIDLFYECTAQTQGKADAKYFAEKCLPSFLPNIARDIYGHKAREIIVVRDPRDIFCSAVSFNQRHGIRAFGAENHRTDEEWFRAIRYGFVQIALSAKRRRQALVIRYEDMIFQLRGTIQEVLRFLRVSDDARVVSAIEMSVVSLEPDFLNHMTSPTPKDSVARWRRHESLDIFQADDEDYLDAMRYFGYV